MLVGVPEEEPGVGGHVQRGEKRHLYATSQRKKRIESRRPSERAERGRGAWKMAAFTHGSTESTRNSRLYLHLYYIYEVYFRLEVCLLHLTIIYNIFSVKAGLFFVFLCLHVLLSDQC